MHVDLSDDEANALVRELDRVIESDRYFLSQRVQILKAIRGKIRPYPSREPFPEPKRYEPPRAARRRR